MNSHSELQRLEKEQDDLLCAGDMQAVEKWEAENLGKMARLRVEISQEELA